MSEKWKNISNTDKSVIKAETIFANKLIGNNSEFRNDICFNNIDISLDEDIIIANVKTVHTHNTIKTILLKCNVIDLSDDIIDISYIDISSSIYTNASGGFYYLRGEDFSNRDLRTVDLSANRIGLLSDISNIGFETDVSFDNTIKTSDISLHYISSLYDSSIILHSDTIIDGSLNVEKLVIREIEKKSAEINGYIEIHGDISTNDHIDALDISVSNSVKVGRDLSLSKIDSRGANNYVSFNTDISINGIVDASGVTISDISALNGNIIELTKDLSINGGASIRDISFDGNISPIDGCLNVVGDISFSKHIQVEKMTIKTITHHSFETATHNDGSGIVFQNDVSIGGIILANNKPKDYRAVVKDDFNDLVFELGSNYRDGALGLLTPAPKLPEGDIVYTDDSLNEFNPDIPSKDISYVNIDANNPLKKTSLYLQVTPGNVIKIATINDDISYHAIRMTRGADVSNWLDVYDDVSHTFGYNTSAIIGLRNGEFNDDSYNRVHFLDVSAFDPEGFDISHMFYSEYLNTSLNGFDISFVNDGSDYRIRIITPSSEIDSELSFNIVAHDYTNYIIRQVSLVHDKHLTAKEPSWNEIKLATFDFEHRKMMDTDLSWNDLSSVQISTADTILNNTAYFDISLNKYFGNNSNTILYHIDLSAINIDSDLDLSYNITVIGDLSGAVELSSNRILVNTSVDNDKEIADYNDTSINIVVHNYYNFSQPGNPKFDFSSASGGEYDAAHYGYNNQNDDEYSTDISRNIVLNANKILHNKPPEFTDLSFYGISYDGNWVEDYYNDNSFGDEFIDFSNINENKIDSTTDPSFIYYIWDTSSIDSDISLQYRIDFSATDPEGFVIDSSMNKDANNTMDFSLQENSLIITTTGLRDVDEPDSSLSIFYDDFGNFKHDCCYNKLRLVFRPFLYKFNEFKFECCGANGHRGPNLALCKTYYTNRPDVSSLDTWWTDLSYLNMGDLGIQHWTVPVTGQYDITIAGAGGGRSYIPDEEQREGYGAKIDFSAVLQKGDKYQILIGQKGILGPQRGSTLNEGYTNYMPYSSSGGGATFFIKNATYSEDEYYNEIGDSIGDISKHVIAVAGGGSGGRTWTRDDNDNVYDASMTVSNASIDDASIDEKASPGFYTDGNTRAKIDVTQIAQGRGYNSLTSDDREYAGEINFGGGGGGGGLINKGGLAGVDGEDSGSSQAQSFFSGGNGGFNTYNPGGGVGNAKEGGFGGGGAGGVGGSGGGGGYAGGGADVFGITYAENSNPNKASWAGGGSSFINNLYNDNYDISLNKPSSENQDVNGYLHIKFNPYNKL